MQKIKKIFETIFLFIIIMLIICFTVSFYNFLIKEISFNQIIGKTGLYFLYTIGYGALEGDAVIQNILAIIGIVALALMSTFLTINLFWRLDDVLLAKDINVKDHKLYFLLHNKGKTICNIEISFMLYDLNNLECTEEARDYFLPMLIKNAKFNIIGDLNDTFWYKTIHSLLTDKSKKLYSILSFVDTKNGQSSIKVQEFNATNILNITYEELIKPVVISNKLLKPIEFGGSISLKNNYWHYHFPKRIKKNENFVMAFYDFKGHLLNLEKYNKDETYLTFNINALEDLYLSLEIKTIDNGAYREDVLISKENKEITIPLNKLNKNLEKVMEICFTIFPNNNKLENAFKVSDLKIITK